MSLLDQIYSLCSNKNIHYSSLNDDNNKMYSGFMFNYLQQQQNSANNKSLPLNQKIIQSKQQFSNQNNMLSLSSIIADNQLKKAKLFENNNSYNQINLKKQQGLYKLGSIANKKIRKFYYQFFIYMENAKQQSLENEKIEKDKKILKLQSVQNGLMFLQSSIQIIFQKNYNNKFKQACFQKIFNRSKQSEKLELFKSKITQCKQNFQKNQAFEKIGQVQLKNIKKQHKEIKQYKQLQENQKIMKEISTKKSINIMQLLKKSLCFKLPNIKDTIQEKLQNYQLIFNDNQNIPNRVSKIYQLSLPLHIQDMNDNINLFIQIQKELHFKFNQSTGTTNTNANNSTITYPNQINHNSQIQIFSCVNNSKYHSSNIENKNHIIFNDDQSSIPKTQSEYSYTSSKNQLLQNFQQDQNINQCTSQFKKNLQDTYQKISFNRKNQIKNTNQINNQIEVYYNANQSFVHSKFMAKKMNQNFIQRYSQNNHYSKTAQFKKYLMSNKNKQKSQSKSHKNVQQKSKSKEKSSIKIFCENLTKNFQQKTNNCNDNREISQQFQIEPVKLKEIKNSKRIYDQIITDFQLSPQKISKANKLSKVNSTSIQNFSLKEQKDQKKKITTDKIKGSIAPINICSKINKNKSKSQIKLSGKGSINSNSSNKNGNIKKFQSKIEISTKPIISLKLKQRQSLHLKSNNFPVTRHESRKSFGEINSQLNNQQKYGDKGKLKRILEIQMLPNAKKNVTARKNITSKISSYIFNTARCKTPKIETQISNQNNQNKDFSSTKYSEKKKLKLLALLQ